MVSSVFSIGFSKRYTSLTVALVISFFAVSVYAAVPTATFSPLDDSAGIAIDTNLVMTFSEDMAMSGGTVSLYKDGGTLVETFSSGALITLFGVTATINPTNNLEKGTSYYVQVSFGTFWNYTFEYFAAITDTTTWNFRTFGGGAANRRQSAKRRANMPKFYHTSAPSLSDVGIFVPGGDDDEEDDDDEETGSGGVITDDDDEEHGSIDSSEPVAATQSLPSALVRTGYDTSGVERVARLHNRLAMQVAFSDEEETDDGQEYESNFQKRVCSRVENRFGEDEKMIQRINVRLEKRFGFTCDL